MIYPCDAKTISFITAPNSETILLSATSTPRTFFNFLNNTYGTDGYAYITDGEIVLIYATPILRQDSRFLIYKTKEEIISHNTGLSDSSSGQIVYVDRDISITTEPKLCSSVPIDIATSSRQAIENGFTHGELVLTFWLTIITTIMIIKMLFFNKNL